jgi:transcriptional regulator with GAF, ATPase, and Fis domain
VLASLSLLLKQGGYASRTAATPKEALDKLNREAFQIPPLRERKGDIPLLAEHFLNLAKKAYRRESLAIAPNAMRWLQNRTWQGNIRELRHLIERTVLIATEHILTENDFIVATAMETRTSGKRGTARRWRNDAR